MPVDLPHNALPVKWSLNIKGCIILWVVWPAAFIWIFQVPELLICLQMRACDRCRGLVALRGKWLETVQMAHHRRMFMIQDETIMKMRLSCDGLDAAVPLMTFT